MRLIIPVAVVGIVLALAQQYAGAQPFGGFRGNPLMLLRQESVQKELKLTDDQANKVKELADKTREKFQEIFSGDEADRGKKKKIAKRSPNCSTPTSPNGSRKSPCNSAAPPRSPTPKWPRRWI